MEPERDLRRERLYLLRPTALDDPGLMVTASFPTAHAPGATAELDRFLAILQGLYRTLGGTELEVVQLREARLGAPRLELGESGADIPIDRFVAALQRWALAERRLRGEDVPPDDPEEEDDDEG